MPLTPIDFSNAIIYKIVCRDTDIPNSYVGSTTNFAKRKCSHKFNCNNPKSNLYNLQVYQFIRAHDGWNNWDMIEIEKYPCNDSNELHARERYWIENLKASLNKSIPNRTAEEIKQYQKQYSKQYSKQYRDSEVNKIKMKTYRKEHKQELDKIKYQKLTCECGCVVTYNNKATHCKSAKHKSLMEQLSPSSINDNLIVEKTI